MGTIDVLMKYWEIKNEFSDINIWNIGMSSIISGNADSNCGVCRNIKNINN